MTDTPTQTPPDATDGAEQFTQTNQYEQPPQQAQNEELAMWSNYEVSYAKISEWYNMTEKHCKPIPNKPTGKGLCPFGGKHYNVETQSVEDNQPFSVPTGSIEKLVCPMHEYELTKRDETRELMAWAKKESTYYGRGSQKWEVYKFPLNLQKRIILYLKNSGVKPNPISIYNQQPGLGVQQNQPNPLGLVLGTPGVIVCANCKGLARHDAENCPTCMQSPTTGLQKVGGFLTGIGTLGAGIATGFVANQTQMYSAQAQAMVPKGCPQCFTQNAGNAVNCTRCGASLSSAPPPPPQQQYGNTPGY